MEHGFTRRDLDHVATLAALTLSDEEAAGLATDLARILAYVDELAAVDASSVPPTMNLVFGPGGEEAARDSALRPDEREPSLVRSEVMAGAPRATEQGFLVPTFVES